MQYERRGDALLVKAALRTVVYVKVCAFATTHAEMRIPHGSQPLSRGSCILLHQDSTRSWTLDCEEHLDNLYAADVSLVANLDHHLGVVHV